MSPAATMRVLALVTEAEAALRSCSPEAGDVGQARGSLRCARAYLESAIELAAEKSEAKR